MRFPYTLQTSIKTTFARIVDVTLNSKEENSFVPITFKNSASAFVVFPFYAETAAYTIGS